MGKKRDPWAEVMGYAETICAHLGLTIERSAHDYEIAKVKGPGVSLLIYPHRNSNGHLSARLRNNGSFDATNARTAMLAMKEGQGLPEEIRWRVATFNTFYAKTLPRN